MKGNIIYHLERIHRLAQSIGDYLKGIGNKEEEVFIREWLKEDDNHFKILSDLADPDYLAIKSKMYGLFESREGFERFLRNKWRADRRRLLRRWSIAAVFVGILTAGIAFWYRPVSVPDHAVQMPLADFMPGKVRATLTLPGGRQILLNDTLRKQLRVEAADLRISGGKLNYRSVDSSGTLVFNQMETPRGGEYRLELADGTRVWLNAESKIRYPVAFTGKIREIWLTGEAYFEVAKDSLQPFIVRTVPFDIEVLGTSFNLNAYPQEIAQATLLEGKVKVTAGEREQIIQPGEQLAVEEGKISLRKVNAEEYITWKNQRFGFTDDLLESVLRKLERWYDVEFLIRDIAVRNYRFTGRLPKYENLDKVLEILELTAHIRFVHEGKVILVGKDE